MCPAQDAKPEEPGSTSGCGLPQSGSPSCGIKPLPAETEALVLIRTMQAHTKAMQELTQAVALLASVTGDAIDAMLAEREHAEDEIEPLIPVSMSMRR